MAITGSTTQPQQVSRAHLEVTVTTTQPQQVSQSSGHDVYVTIDSWPPEKVWAPFSIHSNSANPVHSERPPSHLQFTLSNTADQHPSIETNNQSMSDHPLTSSQPHSMLGNPPGDQSMSNSSQPYSTLGNPGHQSMDICSDAFGDMDWSDVLNQLSDFDATPSSSLLAAHAPAGGVSGLLGGDSFLPQAGALHVDAGGEVPAGHGRHVRMEGDQSLGHVRGCTDTTTVTNGAVLEDGSMEDDSVGQSRRRRRPTTRKWSSDWLLERLMLLSLFAHKEYKAEGELIRDIRNTAAVGRLTDDLTPDDSKDVFTNPHEPPTSRQGRYITRFDPRLEGDKPKNGRRSHSHWNETDVKPIHDPSAPGNIIGLRRTLEYMNGSKRTHWRANEYVAVEALGGDALQIQEEIAVRTVYEEEDSETAPPSKCPKNCPHCHSSGGSYVWKHMTKVFVKGDSETAPSLLYAICHECDDKVLKCPPNYGTKNLNTHLGNVHGIRPPCRSQQVMSKKGRGAVGGSVLSAHQGGVCVE